MGVSNAIQQKTYKGRTVKLVFKSKWHKRWELDRKGDYVLEWGKNGIANNKAWMIERDRAPDTKEGKDRAAWYFTTKTEAMNYWKILQEGEQ